MTIVHLLKEMLKIPRGLTLLNPHYTYFLQENIFSADHTIKKLYG